jgi:hypothetical protein
VASFRSNAAVRAVNFPVQQRGEHRDDFRWQQRENFRRCVKRSIHATQMFPNTGAGGYTDI